MDRFSAHRLGLAVAILTLAVFLTAICIPLAANILKINPQVPLQEAESTPLRLDIKNFGEDIYKLRRNWLDRNFGLRKILVRWEELLDVRVLKSSMPSDIVLAGTDEWLYLGQENPKLNVIDDYRGIFPLTKDQLAIWAKVFAARKEWLAQRGIRYLVVVAPNKANIYPEHIPSRFNKTKEKSKLDQMGRALTDAGVDFLDLRPALLEAKSKGLSYYRTDSHWTPFGAYFAYRAIAEHLQQYFPGIKPTDISEYTISEKPGLVGGLPSMIAMGDLFQENTIILEPKNERHAKEVLGNDARLNYFQPLVVYENSDKTLPRAFVIRDSFVHELIPFLAEHFSWMYFVWPFPTEVVNVRGFDTEAILREKPDIVIEEFVERYFTQPPPPSALSTLPITP